MGRTVGRRAILRYGAAALSGLVATPLLARQSGLPGGIDPGKLLGEDLARQLGKALPPELRLAGDIAEGVLRLEREAKDRQLPLSPLSRQEAPIPDDPQMLYRAAMPRLVALVDRAERDAPQLAEAAGELLARLHATQHLIPARLGFEQRDLLTLPDGGVGLRLPGLNLSDAGSASDTGSLTVEAESDATVEVTLSKSREYDALASEYVRLFDLARPRQQFAEETAWHLTMMRQARPRYASLAARARIPWQFIAAIHGLEASFNFRAHLHNGDFPLSQRTRQVPAGRPQRWLPPSDWESSALDALRHLGFTGQSDWSVPRMLHRIEAFNGFGYRRFGKPSPYLWSFSTIYERGKFVADGRYDPRARSQQCGAAVMLKLLQINGELDVAERG